MTHYALAFRTCQAIKSIIFPLAMFLEPAILPMLHNRKRLSLSGDVGKGMRVTKFCERLLKSIRQFTYLNRSLACLVRTGQAQGMTVDLTNVKSYKAKMLQV
jgi:hypothetical protein